MKEQDPHDAESPVHSKKEAGYRFLVRCLPPWFYSCSAGYRASAQHIHLSPWIAFVVGIVAALPALFRWMRWRLLWRLRNRLFVTYALIGLTPVVLFGLLAAFAAYVLFGQFANFAATSEIHSELVGLAANTDALALHFQQELVRAKPLRAPFGRPYIAAAVPPEARNIINIPGLAGWRLPGRKIAKT